MKLTKFLDWLKTELKKVQWKKVIILGVLMGVILGTFAHCVSLNAYAADDDSNGVQITWDGNITGLPYVYYECYLYKVSNKTFAVDELEELTVILSSYGTNPDADWSSILTIQTLEENENLSVVALVYMGNTPPTPFVVFVSNDFKYEGVTIEKGVYFYSNYNYYPDTGVYISSLTLPNAEINGGTSDPSVPTLPAFSIELAGGNLTSNTQLAIRGETETKTYDGTYFNEGFITLDSSTFTPNYIGGAEYRYRVGISNMPIDSRVLVYSGYPLTSANLVKSYSILSVASSGVSVNDGYVVYFERGTSSTLTNPEFNITFVPDPDYKAAYDEGFDDGYDYGYSAGQVAGRQEGYQSGFEEGKNTSDSAHLGENLLGSALEAPMKALNSFILYQNGDVTITLGLVVGSMLALIILIAFLKLFA